MIGVYAPTDHVNRACRLFAPLSQHEPSNNCKSFCRATFCGLLRETDPQKVARAFVEVLTNAVCYAAKWLKSTLEKLSEKGSEGDSEGGSGQHKAGQMGRKRDSRRSMGPRHGRSWDFSDSFSTHSGE